VHILLGVLLTPDPHIEATLGALDISPTQLVDDARSRLGRPLTPDGGPDLPYTRHGKVVLDEAFLYAEYVSWHWIGTVHLLVALSELEWGKVPRVLGEAGASAQLVRSAVESIAPRMPPESFDEHDVVWTVEKDRVYTPR